MSNRKTKRIPDQDGYLSVNDDGIGDTLGESLDTLRERSMYTLQHIIEDIPVVTLFPYDSIPK
jgi:hypothetical protein